MSVSKSAVVKLESGDLIELHWTAELVLVKHTGARVAYELAFSMKEWREISRTVPASLLLLNG